MEREEPGETAPPQRLTDEQLAYFKRQVAACASEVWRVVAEAGMDPADIRVYCAMGLIWAIGSRAAGKSKEDFMLAAEDAFLNATYEADLEEGEEQDGEA